MSMAPTSAPAPAPTGRRRMVIIVVVVLGLVFLGLGLWGIFHSPEPTADAARPSRIPATADTTQHAVVPPASPAPTPAALDSAKVRGIFDAALKAAAEKAAAEKATADMSAALGNMDAAVAKATAAK